MTGSLLLYGGVVIAFLGVVHIVRPFHWSGIRTRRRATAVTGAGLALALLAAHLPTPTRQTSARDALIDQWLPEWQFAEFHERRVRATPQQVFAALKRVRASDIFLFRTLTFIRNPGRQSQGPNILNAPDEAAIIDVALAGGFVLLGETDQELLLGAVVSAPPGAVRRPQQSTGPTLDPARFRTLDRPGVARAVMNFRAIPEEDGWTRVTTETRVHAVDGPTQRQFGRYWRAIYPGSALIRRSWLRAIEHRLQ
jgi:hypothetical protein